MLGSRGNVSQMVSALASMLSRDALGSSPGVFKILFKPRLDRPTLDIEAGQVWDTAIFFKVHGQKHFDWLKSKFSEDSMW